MKMVIVCYVVCSLIVGYGIMAFQTAKMVAKSIG